MDALEEAYREVSGKIYNYILKLSGNSYTAEEVLQETFYRAMVHITASKDELNFSWFYTVSRNIYFDMVRRQKRISREPISNPKVPGTFGFTFSLLGK